MHFTFQFAKSLKGDSAKLHKMVQMSWTFVNDSLCTTLCLQWEPEIIAIAVMYLAAKLSKFEVSMVKKHHNLRLKRNSAHVVTIVFLSLITIQCLFRSKIGRKGKSLVMNIGGICMSII